MKQGIKIAIIAVVAVILIIVVVLSIKTLSPDTDKVIASTPFEKTVEQRVDEGIAGKNYTSAGSAFTSIMDYIDTEANITLADGAHKIKPEEAAKARTMVFNAYAPMVIEQANAIFNSSAWNDGQLTSVNNEATRLKNSGVGDTGLVAQLGQVVSIISDYRAAWGVVNNAKNCSSVGEISTLTARAENYRHAPLTNSTSLANSLSGVAQTAKNAVVSSIYSNAVAIYNKANKCSYSSWDSFYSAREKVQSSINAYASSYGSPEKLQQAQGYLNAAESYVSNCLSNSYDSYDYYDYY